MANCYLFISPLQGYRKFRSSRPQVLEKVKDGRTNHVGQTNLITHIVKLRYGILRERREHARGRNLADCGRICGSPLKICRLNLRNVEEMFQMINNAESHS